MANQMRKCEGFGFIREDLDILDKYLRERGLDLDALIRSRHGEAFNPIGVNGDAAYLAALLGVNDVTAVPKKYEDEYDIVVRMRDWRWSIVKAAIRKAKSDL